MNDYTGILPSLIDVIDSRQQWKMQCKLMTDRHYFRCSTCQSAIITRTAIGHGSYQAFVFPCPGCGIELAFAMRLYPERIPKVIAPEDDFPILWEYTDFKNVSEIE